VYGAQHVHGAWKKRGVIKNREFASAIEMQAINPGVIPPQPVRPEARNPPGQPTGSRWDAGAGARAWAALVALGPSPTRSRANHRDLAWSHRKKDRQMRISAAR
jgi:hypothetical protein